MESVRASVNNMLETQNVVSDLTVHWSVRRSLCGESVPNNARSLLATQTVVLLPVLPSVQTDAEKNAALEEYQNVMEYQAAVPSILILSLELEYISRMKTTKS